MQIVPDYYSYPWLTFGNIPKHDFKQESKFDNKECCAERHERKHAGKLFIEA
jgi:hypothetical protein